MKLIAVGLFSFSIVFAQSTAPRSPAARDCSINSEGSNNTNTVTCYAVDKKLADQIQRLVQAARRDNQTLKEISETLDTLLASLGSGGSLVQQAPNGINIGPGAVVPNPTVNNTVNNYGPRPPQIDWQSKPLDGNPKSESDDRNPGASVQVTVKGRISSAHVCASDATAPVRQPRLWSPAHHLLAPTRRIVPMSLQLDLEVYLRSKIEAGTTVTIIVRSKDSSGIKILEVAPYVPPQ